MTPKKTRIKLPDLDRKLCELISKYVRLKSANYNGLVQCVTCNGYWYWNQMDAGHYISRIKTATRFNLRNIHPQCFKCNRLKDGNKIAYREFMLNELGLEGLEKLEESSKDNVIHTREWYLKEIERFKNLTKKIQEELCV